MYIRVKNTTDTSTNIIIDEPNTIYVVDKDGLIGVVNIDNSHTLNNLTPGKKYCLTTSNEDESVFFMTYPVNITKRNYDPSVQKLTMQLENKPVSIITYDNHPSIPEIHQLKGDGV